MGLLGDVHLYHLVSIGLIALVLRYLYAAIRLRASRRRFARQHGCKPANPLPARDPIFMLDSMYEAIQALKQHRMLELGLGRFNGYGHTMSAKQVNRPVIMTREPENIKTVLSIKFKDFRLGERLSSLGLLLGEGIFTSDGEHWAQSRAMIRPNFVKDQVADLDVFEQLIPDLFALIPRDGSTVDLQELFFGYTIDSATEFLFGHSVDSLKSTLRGETSDRDFAHAFNYAQHSVSMRFRLGALRHLYFDAKADRCFRLCKEVVAQFVDEAVSYREKNLQDVEKTGQGGGHDHGHDRKRNKYLFLHGLAEQTSDKRRMRDELLNILLAGRDTTAGLLSNMFFVLAKRPDIWAKIRKEVDNTLSGRLPTYEQLRNLTYVKYCLKESLRLHPVVPVNSRCAVRDTFLPVGGGPDGKSPVFVPKDAFVGYSVFAMHRREDLYGADAHEFRPERWEHIRPGWEYLPFNGGPRICPGQQYALTEASYVTVRMAQEFKALESRDPGPWVEGLTLTLSSGNGTKVGLTPA